MNSITKTLVLAVVVTLGHLGNAPSAYAELTISIAEVRGLAAYVKGSDAGKKQQIFWEGELVTKANGKETLVSKETCPRIVLRTTAKEC